MSLLTRILADVRTGKKVSVTWAELQNEFDGRDVKEQWERMVAWAGYNDLALSAANFQPTHFDKVTVEFWSSLPQGLGNP